MWTKSKSYDTAELLVLPEPPLATSACDNAFQNGLLESESYHFISALSYTIIPQVSPQSGTTLLQWVLSRWAKNDILSLDMLSQVELFQIEFFFTGTDTGHVFAIPLVPASTLQRVIEVFSSEPWCSTLVNELKINPSCNVGSQRLLHQHGKEDPVVGLDLLGTVIASSADTSLMISLFYPVPKHVVTIPHSNGLRSVLLWEGKPFADFLSENGRKERSENEAIYVFTGGDLATVRLWRVNVVECTFVLLHVLVMTPQFSGMHSSLEIAKREDHRRSPIERETSLTVLCLALDGNERLLAGVEGGVYCWCVNDLVWKTEGNSASQHPLLWNEKTHEYYTEKSSEAVGQVHLRCERLVNHHVWLRNSDFVTGSIARWRLDGVLGSPLLPTKWKSKHNTCSGGASVGIVSNEVAVYPFKASAEHVSNATIGSVLQKSLVTVSFDRELRNDLTVPVECVEPVVYPLTHLATPMAACYSMAVLERGARLITCTSDTLIHIWEWSAEREMYTPLVAAGQRSSQRCLGRHVGVLRSPDIFVTAGYDDGLVKEWHLYSEPESILRCERRFTLLQTDGGASKAELGNGNEIDQCVQGVSSLFVVPYFVVIFVVGAFERTIQTFQLSQTQGCEAPPDFIYNGFRTIKIPLFSKTPEKEQEY